MVKNTPLLPIVIVFAFAAVDNKVFTISIPVLVRYVFAFAVPYMVSDDADEVVPILTGPAMLALPDVSNVPYKLSDDVDVLVPICIGPANLELPSVFN